MTKKEFIEKRNEFLDILEADSCGDIFLDSFQRAMIINNLERLEVEGYTENAK